MAFPLELLYKTTAYAKRYSHSEHYFIRICNLNKLIATIVSVYALAVGGVPSAVAQDLSKTKAAPVDMRMCNFREGKTMADLDKFTAKFRAYANKENAHYSAWTLTPEYETEIGYDVIWMGAWPDAEAYGTSTEKWNAEGRQVAALFQEAVDCGGHTMFASLPINAPQGTPEDGLWMSWQCTLNEDVTIDQAYKAHLDAGLVMKGMGSLAVSWFFQPMMGTGNIDYDYTHVTAFYRYSDLGATMEMFLNHQGRVEQQKILAKVSSCTTPNLFDAVSVRARDEV